MATSSYRSIQDQNLNILYTGTTPAGKSHAAKADKKGGLGGRKALNDISNSAKPSVLHSAKKDISIDKDPSAVKAKSKKAADKGKIGGRKALSDLTNSVKPPTTQVHVTGRKLYAVPEDIMEEGFLHNHQECIKALKNVDVKEDYFLMSVGLSNNTVQQARVFPPTSKKPMSKMKKRVEMEEMPEDQCIKALKNVDVKEDYFLMSVGLSNNTVQQARVFPPTSKKPMSKMKKRVEMEEMPEDQCRKPELTGFCSPACRSPQSPKAPYMGWEGGDLCDLMMIDSP